MSGAVWLLTELFYPDSTSTAYLLTQIAEQIAQTTPVNVICGPAGYDADSVSAQRPIAAAVRISRVHVSAWNKNRLSSRVIRSVLISVGLATRLLRRARTLDTVVIVTNPPTLLLLVAAIARARRLRLVVIVHDVFPESLIAAGILKSSSPFLPVLRAVFNTAYRAADELIVLGRDMRALFLTKLAANPHATTVSIIENWAETSTIHPAQRVATGSIRLRFAGNFGRVQGLLPLLEAFRVAGNSELSMDLVGSGALHAKLVQFVESHGLKNVRILPAFARSQQQEILNDCDIGVVSLAAGMLGLGVPSKAYNILAAGKPILFIGDPMSEIALMVAETKVGWAFSDHGEPLIAFLRALRTEHRGELEARGASARALAESRYGQERQLREYALRLAPT